MANDDFGVLQDLLDGLDNEIAAISFDTTIPKAAVDPKRNVKKEKKLDRKSTRPSLFNSSEFVISHSLFNTPALPFKAQAVRDYMEDLDGNLCFMESEMIEVVAVDDSAGLFMGEMAEGRRGWFPRSHVKIIGMKSKTNFTSTAFADFGNELTYAPTAVDACTEEDFSKLNFDDPPSPKTNEDANDFSGVTFADLGGLDNLTIPQFDALDAFEPSSQIDKLGPPTPFEELGHIPQFDELALSPKFDANLGQQGTRELRPASQFDKLKSSRSLDQLDPRHQLDKFTSPPQFEEKSHGFAGSLSFDEFIPSPHFDPPQFDIFGSSPPQCDDFGQQFGRVGSPLPFNELSRSSPFENLAQPSQFDPFGSFYQSGNYGQHSQYNGNGQNEVKQQTNKGGPRKPSLPPVPRHTKTFSIPIPSSNSTNHSSLNPPSTRPSPPNVDFRTSFSLIDDWVPSSDTDTPRSIDAPPSDVDMSDMAQKKEEKHPWDQLVCVHGEDGLLDEFPWEQDQKQEKEKETPMQLKGSTGGPSTSTSTSTSTLTSVLTCRENSHPLFEDSSRTVTEPDFDDITLTIEFTPIVQSSSAAQNPTQQREQDRLRKTQVKELAAREVAVQQIRSKRANGHKVLLGGLEKQHDKDVATQKKDEADRPAKLNAQHIADQKALQKELENENKNRINAHKRTMKAWVTDQQTELKVRLSTLKLQYRKDKNTLKQKKAQMEAEAKIRQQQYQERDLLDMEHQFHQERSDKEHELGLHQLTTTHDLELELQQSRHRLERRHLHELHREQQKVLQEMHEDDREVLGFRLPIEEKHLHEQFELDQDQLTKQHLHEIEELHQQLLNQQKNDRREYAKKKKLEEKDHLNNLKLIKRANSKDKNIATAEKLKFEKEQEKEDRDFEQSLKDEATRKENELRARHEQQKKEMRAIHRSAEEKLRQQHDNARIQLEKKQMGENSALVLKLKLDLAELLDRQHKEVSALQKRQHEQHRALVKDHGEHRTTLFEKHYAEKKELYATHATQLLMSTLAEQDKEEQQQFEQQTAKDRLALKSELETITIQLEERLAIEVSELKAEQEKDKREVLF